ncbi:MAG: flagellar biosynthesis anti-sigma factor FlgM [Cycloclasticus sp.]
MSIKIKGTSNKLSQTGSSKTAGSGKNAKPPAATSPGVSSDDRVDLTETASRLQQIEQALSNIPIVDDARVESVSQSIKSGEYQIDNEKIAERIITNESSLKEVEK